MSLTEFVIMPGTDYQDACDAIREKTGGTDPVKSGEMGAQIRGISGGAELPALTNPGTAANLESGYQLIDGDGNTVTGTAAVVKTMKIVVRNYSIFQTTFWYINQSGSRIEVSLSNSSSKTVKARENSMIVFRTADYGVVSAAGGAMTIVASVISTTGIHLDVVGVGTYVNNGFDDVITIA